MEPALQVFRVNPPVLTHEVPASTPGSLHVLYVAWEYSFSNNNLVIYFIIRHNNYLFVVDKLFGVVNARMRSEVVLSRLIISLSEV